MLLGADLDDASWVTAVHEPPLSPITFEDFADALPVMLWRINGSFDYDWANKAWYEFTGGTAEEERSFGWVDKIHPEDRDRVVEQLDRAFDERQAVTTEFRLLARDGDYRLIRDTGRPIFKRGEFMGFVGTRADVTAAGPEGQRSSIECTRIGEVLASAGPMLAASFGADGGLSLAIEEELTLALAPLAMVRLLSELAIFVTGPVSNTNDLPIRAARWGEFGVISITVATGAENDERITGQRDADAQLAALLSRHGGRLWVEERGENLSLVSIGLPLAT